MSLQRILEQQQEQLDHLLSSLEQERELLASSVPDGPALAETAHRKMACFDRLENLELQFLGVQKKLGLPESLSGKKSAALQEGCDALLAHVLDTAGRVFRLNQMNGGMVRSRLGWNERLLEFIRDAQDSWIYCPQGHLGPQRSTISSKA